MFPIAHGSVLDRGKQCLLMKCSHTITLKDGSRIYEKKNVVPIEEERKGEKKMKTLASRSKDRADVKNVHLRIGKHKEQREGKCRDTVVCNRNEL